MANRRRIEKRAGRRYEKFWNRVSNEYGTEGKPSPTVRLYAPKSGGSASYVDDVEGENGYIKRVNLSARRTRQFARLGKPLLNQKQKRTLQPRRKRRIKTRKKLNRNSLKRLTLHEWAHVYQDPEAFGLPPSHGGTEEEMARYHKMKEGAAETFALRTARRRFGKTKRAGYLPEMRMARKEYDRRFLRKGQFGERYGQDPRQPR